MYSQDVLPKISDQKWHRGEGVHANSDIFTKKNYVQVFTFHLFLVSAAAAELWLAFRLGCHFKHWPDLARTQSK